MFSFFSLSIPAFADGANTITVTQTFHNAVQVIPSADGGANLCTGAPGTITLTYSGLVHATIQPTTNGTPPDFWNHFHLTGEYSFVPDDAGSTSYDGSFVLTDVSGSTTHTFVTTGTATFHLTGSDGSVLDFRYVSHVTLLNPYSANAQIVVNFSRGGC